MLGHTDDDLVGKDVGDFLYPDSHSAITGPDVLRPAGSVLTCHHNEHGLARSIVTKSVFLFLDDPVLLVVLSTSPTGCGHTVKAHRQPLIEAHHA